MITDLLGSPSPLEVRHLTSHTVVKELLSQQKPACLGKLYKLSSHANHYTVHLLSQLLKFDPVSTWLVSVEWKCPSLFLDQEKRITCMDALYHPYLEEGRVRYHTYLCSCCYTDTCGFHHYAPILEPSAAFSFNQDYEREFGSLSTVKGIFQYLVWAWVTLYVSLSSRVRLCVQFSSTFGSTSSWYLLRAIFTTFGSTVYIQVSLDKQHRTAQGDHHLLMNSGWVGVIKVVAPHESWILLWEVSRRSGTKCGWKLNSRTRELRDTYKVTHWKIPFMWVVVWETEGSRMGAWKAQAWAQVGVVANTPFLQVWMIKSIHARDAFLLVKKEGGAFSFNTNQSCTYWIKLEQLWQQVDGVMVGVRW